MVFEVLGPSIMHVWSAMGHDVRNPGGPVSWNGPGLQKEKKGTKACLLVLLLGSFVSVTARLENLFFLHFVSVMFFGIFRNLRFLRKSDPRWGLGFHKVNSRTDERDEQSGR